MIAILVFASGFTALIYEILWVKTLTLIFGTTIYAVSTVLTAFFTGLALGNYYLGRLSDRLRNPLLLYGTLELLIGLYAVLYPHMLSWFSPFYVSVETARGAMTAQLIRFLFGFIVLLPPTTLMGGTLPAVVRYAAGARGEVGRSLASLYSVNTAGAVVGTFTAAFFLVGELGVRLSIELTAALNFLVAGVALSIFGTRSMQGPGSTVRQRAPVRGPAWGGEGKNSKRWVVLNVAALSGFAALGYEVVWTRMLIHFTGTTTYAFGTILITFLAGIAAGGYTARWVLRRPIDRWLALAFVEAFIGVGAALSALVIDAMPRIEGYLAAHTVMSSTGNWGTGLTLSLVKGGAVMLPPTFFMGISLPIAVGILESGPRSAGGTVGVLFSANTVGSIAGSLATGFFLIPWIGAGWTLTILVALNGFLFLWILQAAPVRIAGRRRLTVIGLLVLAVLVSVSRKDLFRHVYAADDLVFFAEGPSATVAVVRDEDPLNPPYLRMFVDGNGLSGTDYSGRRYMKLLGHLPVMLCGADPESALVICLGTGMTLGAVSLYPSVRRLDCVEISREVIRAAGCFSAVNHGVLGNDRVHLVVDDGRNYLLTTRRKYDVITLEPPPPRSAGVVNLYSKEFYLEAKARLAKNGVLCQWIPLHDQSEGDVQALIRTFDACFPHVTSWLIERNELALIGSVERQSIEVQRISELLAVPSVSDDLASIDIIDPEDILSLFLTDERGLRWYAQEGAVVTDDRPIIEYFLFRWGNRTYRYSPYVAEAYLPALERLELFRIDVRSLLRGWDERDRNGLFDHEVAMRHFIDGTILRNRGEEEAARSEFLLAARRVPDNGYFQQYLGSSAAQLEEAQRRFEADPDNVAAGNRVGYIRYLRGDYERARRAFEAVLARDPSNVEALVNLGMVFEMLGTYDDAERVLSNALKLDRGNLSAAIQSRLREVSLMRSARGDSDPKRLHEVAVALWRGNRYAEAVDWFKRTTDAAPGWELARYNLAATYEAMRRYQEALTAYGMSYRLSNTVEAANNIEKLRLLLSIERDGGGEVELMNGDRVSVSWDDPLAYNLLGIRFYRNEEYREAIGAFMRAIMEKPGYAEALANAGDAYYALAEYDGAVSCYARAIDSDPALREVVEPRMRESMEKTAGSDGKKVYPGGE